MPVYVLTFICLAQLCIGTPRQQLFANEAECKAVGAVLSTSSEQAECVPAEGFHVYTSMRPLSNRVTTKIISGAAQSEGEIGDKYCGYSRDSRRVEVKTFADMPENDRSKVISGAIFLVGVVVVLAYIAVSSRLLDRN